MTKRHKCELAWRAALKEKRKRGGISSQTIRQVFAKYFEWGLCDVDVVAWCKSRFGIKTTYALGFQLRDIACGHKPQLLNRKGHSYDAKIAA